ncbi:bifunctional 2-polyprenyl-6-hydroxyphenol methylase/3-demethylubiquinol 3-O-methyltransferase UbiG [Kibdelosporangium persicum]|uniref:Ubiquinone biosynthesis O-methyltransferase n=1 Tax=Kibdelosporangium persicum TaxID=2698649 RepID=A0ABX2F0J7_9PSEU|nr:class I SAM-dependent methyltransferase [Kibdelosporangium persicum]NRN64472.1 Ubiquinone biosynthesis O-methyltransferase [Kibdelosporangium persicum]
MTTAQEFWENRYHGDQRIWKGTPNALLVETVSAIRPGRALDLGCGEGGDAVWLAAQGWEVTAVDIAASALRRTADLAESAGVKITTEQHDLAESFPGGTFDLINAQYLQTPFDLDRTALFRTAANALAPDGVLLIVDHGSLHPWSTADPDTYFPSAQEIYAGLELDPSRWRADRLDAPQREAKSPDGQIATVTDTVILVVRSRA